MELWAVPMQIGLNMISPTYRTTEVNEPRGDVKLFQSDLWGGVVPGERVVVVVPALAHGDEIEYDILCSSFISVNQQQHKKNKNM